MRLGFHYHVPAVLKGGRIMTPGHQGRFIESLADHCSEVVCFLHSPRPAEEAQMDYTIQSPKVRLVDLGPHASVPRRLLSARRCARLLRTERRSLDALLLRGASPLLPLVASAVHPLPTVLLLVSDELACVSGLPQPRWRKEAIRFFWRLNRCWQNRIAQRSLTFVNSRKLLLEMEPYVPHLIETRTTTLSASDFFEREDTCLKPPCRLLYCGRMSTEKGLLDLVRAMSILTSRGVDVVMELVGPQEPNDDVLSKLQHISHEMGIGNRITYHGYKPIGPELFNFYQRADVFVLASRSEGFPRVIWEAMSQSLPVIATRVGSIPHFLDHLNSAFLVAPKDPERLAEAIHTVIHDGCLRKRMIRNGLELARANTLEKRSIELITQIHRWVSPKPCV